MEKNHKVDIVCNGLFKKLAAQATSQRYHDGQAVFSQGEAANAMFRVEKGNVKLTFKPLLLALQRRKRCIERTLL